MVTGYRFICGFGVFLCLAVMASSAWAEEPPSKVAVMPFVVHGQQDVQKTRDTIAEILTRQITSEGVKLVSPQELAKVVKPQESVSTEEQARAIGHRLQADYVLMGSFNQIGSAISIDAKLVNVSQQKPTVVLFGEEKGMENLAAATSKIVQQMAVHVLAKAVIAEVKVGGNDRIEADAIKAVVKSKKGELIRPDQVKEDIKSIFKMGFFEKVDADISDSPTGKVLTFVVEENPTIQELKITGTKKIKEKDVLAAIGTRAHTVLQRNLVTEDVQKILKLYQQKGYFATEVTPKIEFPKDPRKATVTFDIKENKKIYIKKISFSGNQGVSSRKLRGVMQTKKKDWLYWITEHGILQKEILDTDIDRITVYYHDKGYMDAKVGTPEIDRKDDGFYITIPVNEGERYKVSGVQITGDVPEDIDKTLKRLKTKQSDFFSREKLRQDLDALTKTYSNVGYARAEVTPNVKRETSDRTTDIVFDVKKGELVHIGRIFITGNTRTRDYVIRREIRLAEGQLFSSEKLEQSIQTLKKLDYFEDVEIVPSESDQPGIMNLHIKVKEKATGTFSIGGGFSSDDGLFASGQITQRNLLGRGQTLSLKLYFGQEAERYVLSFTEPYFLGRRLSLGGDVYDWLRDYTDFTQEAIGFRVRSAYPFGQYSRLNLWYTFEDSNVTDVSSGFTDVQTGHEIKSSITVGVERDTTDHPFLPTRGAISSVTTEYASKYFGGDEEFAKLELRQGYYYPLFWKFVGFVRGQFGYIGVTGNDSYYDIPVYERFFLGGINSLRAWSWGDVGPTDSSGYVVGGLTYAFTNIELLFPVSEKYGIRGVLFFDAGNAFRGIDEMAIDKFRTDAGGGIRWNSPFGPLRVEVGYNLDKQKGEDAYKFQFSAGAFF